jgi:heme exporter protein D
MDFGPYTSFIAASYAVVFGGLAIFIAWLFADGRRQQRLINDLEARGVRRRPAAKAN